MVKIDSSGDGVLSALQKGMESKNPEVRSAVHRGVLSQSSGSPQDTVVLDNPLKMEAKAFGQRTKSANEAVGFLQVADSHLSRIQNALETKTPNDAGRIIQEASFMGKKIFGESMEIPLSNGTVSFSMDVDADSDYATIVLKRNNIADMLSKIRTDLDNASQMSPQTHDFSTLDPRMLAKMKNMI
jgi:hypothetical protein